MSGRRRNVARALAGVRPGTVLDHYTATFGVHKGAYRAAEMVQIAMVVREHGRDFSNPRYIEYWGVEERTGWLHRAHAREVYGDGWRDVAQALADAMDEAGLRAPGPAVRLRFDPRAALA